MKGQAVVKQLESTIGEVQKKVGERLFEYCARYPNTDHHGNDEVPTIDELIKPADRVLLKRRIFALKRDGLPPIVTHNMVDDSTDPVLNHIRRVQLFNKPEDRVKIIFHPEFLNANNPILSLDYDEFVRGVIWVCSHPTMNLGVTLRPSVPLWVYLLLPPICLDLGVT